MGSDSPQAKKVQAKLSLTYVVKPGDNLSVIAAWFKLHGYGALYDWNKSVIGTNPNLIYPGERITISDGVMALSGKRSLYRRHALGSGALHIPRESHEHEQRGICHA